MSGNLAVCVFLAWCVCSVLCTNTSSHTSHFLTCPNDIRLEIEETCRGSDDRCKKVSIPLTNDVTNLLCIDNENLRPGDLFTYYKLVGCPFAFFNPLESISGVCSIDQGNGTSLVLSSHALTPGFYSFDCLVNNRSSEYISKYVAVANDSNPFRTVRIDVNGELQNSTDISVDVGDSIGVLVLAVGNVSNITASDERFACSTKFLCSNQGNPMRSRYRRCSLRSVDASDDGRTLRILLDGVELETIRIALNERPHSPPSHADSTSTTSASTAAVAANAMTSSVATAMTSIIAITSTGVNITATATTVVNQVNMLDVTSMLVTTLSGVATPIVTNPATPSSVSHSNTGYNTTPASPATDKTPHEGDHDSFVISGLIAGTVLGLVLLIVVIFVICCKCKRSKMPSRSVEPAMVDSDKKVLSYSCRHCDRFDQELKARGYVVQKVPQNQSTGTKKHKLVLNNNIPIIQCGYSECQAQFCGLEGLPVSENVCQLQDDADVDCGENHLPSNQKVKVISCAGQAPMNEVLQWLDSVSCGDNDTQSRRGSISYSHRSSFSRKDSINSLSNNLKILVDRTGRIMESQEQTNSGIHALHIDLRQACD